MILASGIEANQVIAYVGPIVAMLGAVGGFIGWLMSRISKSMKAQVDQLAALNAVRQENTNNQLNSQADLLRELTKQLQTTSLSVARIEGRTQVKGNDNAI